MTSCGKKIAPQAFEAVPSGPTRQEVLRTGRRRKYFAVLIVPDFNPRTQVPDLAARKSGSRADCRPDRCVALYQEIIDAAPLALAVLSHQENRVLRRSSPSKGGAPPPEGQTQGRRRAMA